ncbi:cyanophycinase [Adhaeribacter soli]|uniref:Cyanophycinase n=1 Tax=Adhaeribacter soli TaxID=2607655 RepID=A0A5N1IPT1_9BACT|nr:cyanophycinase [Adhaeribacter soli]KAA9331778.1 cyanophycinase [Adhaeribacter soli]
METPKGKIVAIGGKEDKGSIPQPTDPELRNQVRFFENGILKRIHDELYGLGTRIEVVTTATQFPAEVGQAYLDAFLLLGCDNVGQLPIHSREDADEPEYLERLRKADGVMFTGGDQTRIAEIFPGSKALQILKQQYWQKEKFLISGTSAGAMALAGIMITASDERDPLVKGTVQLGEGLGLLQQVIIDTHFINRRRMPRMIESIAAYPDHIGIGLGEDTGILITRGTNIETIGSGLVMIMDGRKLKDNNYQQVEPGEQLCLENILLHVLPRGKSFQIPSGNLV